MKASILPSINPALLEVALTHRSYVNEHKNVQTHNERLEFLGDAALEVAVSEFLYHKFPEKPEGELTALRSALVRTTTLAQIAQSLKLGEKLRLSKGEAASGGRNNQALLANTFEAVVGALYLDQGLSAVGEFLEANLFPHITRIIEQKLHKDFKSSLQESVQSQGKDAPSYQVIKESGPDHSKQFTIAVYVDRRAIGTGTGKSKQEAEQQAAKSALEKLGAS